MSTRKANRKPRIKRPYRGAMNDLAVHIRSGFVCTYCGCDLRQLPSKNITIEHLVCFTHGGGDEATNLVSACRSCNSSRGARTINQFATPEALIRIARQVSEPLNLELAKAIIKGKLGR